MTRILITAVFLFLLTGCSTLWDTNIVAHRVSANRYSTWTCEQLTEEGGLVDQRLKEMRETHDALVTTSSIAIFFLVAIDVPADFKAEASELKGERIAIAEAIEKKNCPL